MGGYLMFAKWKLPIMFAVLLLAGVLVYSIYATSSHGNRSLKKNYGIANATIKIYSNGVPDEAIDIDSVVPSKDKLIKSLTEKGYTITQHDTIDNINISVSRIYAKKGKGYVCLYTVCETFTCTGKAVSSKNGHECMG